MGMMLHMGMGDTAVTNASGVTLATAVAQLPLTFNDGLIQSMAVFTSPEHLIRIPLMIPTLLSPGNLEHETLAFRAGFLAPFAVIAAALYMFAKK